MKFLIDAQLPRRISHLLNGAGHDALHTLDLPLGNLTPDMDIAALADNERRIVVTKDADFVTSYLLFQRPQRLLLISTGNIRNTDLTTLLLTQLPLIEAAFASHHYIELSRSALIIHS
ncbi:DUF5615 family PIN-like protein [Nostoc sp. CHAB 5824]|nr:DUF5615 family PIN-like protein [Nostoc sp. CHAB 5824]